MTDASRQSQELYEIVFFVKGYGIGNFKTLGIENQWVLKDKSQNIESSKEDSIFCGCE